MSTINDLDSLNSEEILINEISPMSSTNNFNTGTLNNNYATQTRSKTYPLTSANTNNGAYTATNYNTRNTNNTNTTNGIYNANTMSAKAARSRAYLTDVNPNYNTTGIYSGSPVNRIATGTNTTNYNNYSPTYTSSTNDRYTNASTRYTTNLNNYRTNYNNANYNNANYNNASTRYNPNYTATRTSTDSANITPSGAYRYIPMDDSKSQSNANYGGATDYLSRDNLNTYVSKIENTIFYVNRIGTSKRSKYMGQN